MTGYQPKTEKTCETCVHAANHGRNDECTMCGFDRDNWTPKPITPPTGGSSGERPPPSPSAAAMIEAIEGEIRDRSSDAKARNAELKGEIARLKRREADLLEANDRYLKRARNAEAKLADADAATIAMEAKVVFLERIISRAHAILDQAPGMESKGNLSGLCDAVLRAHAELGGDAGPKRGG